ncbi:MAG: NAD-dependent epimerase/dehydratase family protein, partial [Pseudarthrobacter sp.]
MTIGAGTTAGTEKTALVVGATGIAGSALVDTLSRQGWSVLALSRKPGTERPGVRWLSADLTSAASLAAALGPENPSHVFFTAWS